MPYIPREFRASAKTVPVGAGELNYQLTTNILAYLKQRGYNYSTMNEIVGALECTKHEFQRRVMNPYEDAKCVQNGEVYQLGAYETKKI